MYPVDTSIKIPMRLANGRIMESAGLTVVGVDFGNVSMAVDFYVMNHDGFPLLLGNTWNHQVESISNPSKGKHTMKVRGDGTPYQPVLKWK